MPLAAGTEALPGVEAALAAAASIGYPVIAKASAGGGGIGMRTAEDPDELAEVFASVKRLAGASFGDDAVYLERFVRRARHVEVQVFGDGAGRVLSLSDRDCTLQRRHQKVIEEAPAPGLPGPVREALHASARALAAEARYRSAGTVEFIYDADRDEASFLEFNTRLQVEHPVTEQILGIDLVEWMIRAAAGDTGFLDDLPDAGPAPTGFAVEARVYAEDPARGHLPSAGLLTCAEFPDSARVDTWIERGIDVPAAYDPMLAKIITFGATRDGAWKALSAALAETRIEGVHTNLGQLRAAAVDERVAAAEHTTGTVASIADASPRIDVIAPGVLTTVQDWPGRIGHWQVGVPPSGPMDDYSFRLGNRALGNDEGAPDSNAPSPAPPSGSPPPRPCASPARPPRSPSTANRPASGSRSRSRPEPNWPSARSPTPEPALTYSSPADSTSPPSSVRPRPSRPDASAATPATSSDPATASLPGPRPAPVAPPSRLASLAFPEPERLRRAVPFPAPFRSRNARRSGTTGPSRSLPAPNRPRTTSPVRTWRPSTTPSGPSKSTPDAPGSASTVPARRGRAPTGRSRASPSNLHDNPYSVGTVNFTGDTPALLGPDGPSLGGFACPFTVTVADRWKLGQLRPGDTVRFLPVAEDEADRLRAAPVAAPVPLVGAADDDATLASIDGDANRPAAAYRRAGDDAILLEYGPMHLDLGLRMRVGALMDALAEAQVPGIVDTTPGVRSLHLHVDPDVMPIRTLTGLLTELEADLPDIDDMVVPSREVRMPIAWNDPVVDEAIARYGTNVRDDALYNPSNIEFIRRINGLDSVEDVARIATEARWLVLGLGDVYLGAPAAVPVDPRHRLVTTKYNPARTWTAEGTVGIGGSYMCIYGMDSPGGYQLVGRTAPIWAGLRDLASFRDGLPWLLRFFDRVVFERVSEEELAETRRELAAGRTEIDIREGVFAYAEYRKLLSDNAESIAAFTDRQAAAFEAERRRWAEAGEFDRDLTEPAPAATEIELADDETLIEAPMAASVWRVDVAEGDRVEAGTAVVVLEAMKLEMPVAAPASGTVRRVLAEPGDQAAPGTL
ncbi:hypothetical protein GCM10029992_45560 [Glycomyces albus]